MPTLHQFSPVLRLGDAISNQAAAIQRVAKKMGIATTSWHVHHGTHPTLASRPYQHFRPTPNDVLLLHYSTASPLDPFLRPWASQLALCYHNITPPEHYAAFNPALAVLLREGRARLSQHFFGAVRAYAGTAYNRQELSKWGYQNIGALPYHLSAETLPAAAQTPDNQRLTQTLRDKTNWLFVGRIAPNKRQDAIVRAFDHYRRFFNPNARLLLVGSAQSAGSYERYLHALIDVLDMREHVHMVSPPDAELAAYYAAANVFVSLSEHEGFGVPLVEAMWMGVPIIALARAAVPETMGNAGILLESNQPDLVAACVHTVLTQPALRESILRAQRQQATSFLPDRSEVVIRQTLMQEWFPNKKTVNGGR